MYCFLRKTAHVLFSGLFAGFSGEKPAKLPDFAGSGGLVKIGHFCLSVLLLRPIWSKWLIFEHFGGPGKTGHFDHFCQERVVPGAFLAGLVKIAHFDQGDFTPFRCKKSRKSGLFRPSAGRLKPALVASGRQSLRTNTKSRVLA